MFRHFDENIRFRRLFFYWLGFFILGIFLMNLITLLFPGFAVSEQEFIEEACTINRIIDTLIAPFVESLLFIFLPFWICKKLNVSVNKGVVVGILLWIMLHLLTRNIPFIFYISFIGFFYYRLVQIRKWKEVVIFHFIPNILGVTSCFF